MGLDESIPSSPAIPSLAEEGAIDEVLSDLPPLKLRNLIQLEYKSLFSWESVVRSVDGIERLESGELMAFVVWADEATYSWVPVNELRLRCPQKVLDFVLSLLIFKDSIESK